MARDGIILRLNFKDLPGKILHLPVREDKSKNSFRTLQGISQLISETRGTNELTEIAKQADKLN